MQSLDNWTRATAESYLSWHCLSSWKTGKLDFMSNNNRISHQIKAYAYNSKVFIIKNRIGGG